MEFGDVIFNGWAAKENPTRIGIFVKKKGKGIELTNGKGKFWELIALERVQILGNVLQDNINLADYKYEDKWGIDE
jgi:hypothetical protein